MAFTDLAEGVLEIFAESSHYHVVDDTHAARSARRIEAAAETRRWRTPLDRRNERARVLKAVTAHLKNRTPEQAAVAREAHRVLMQKKRAVAYAERGVPPKKMTCWSCGAQGEHRQINCPKKQQKKEAL